LKNKKKFKKNFAILKKIFRIRKIINKNKIMENLDFFITKIEKLKLENRYEEAIFELEDAIANYENNYKLYEELADIYLFL
jgi:transcription termination factor Rho